MSGPMGKKSVDALPGIDDDYKKNLNEIGIITAAAVRDKFEMLNKDERDFKHWLKIILKFPKSDRINQCYECVRDHCDQYNPAE